MYSKLILRRDAEMAEENTLKSLQQDKMVKAIRIEALKAEFGKDFKFSVTRDHYRRCTHCYYEWCC
jgi:ATP-dependent helicase/DNAse subunit B